MGSVFSVGVIEFAVLQFHNKPLCLKSFLYSCIIRSASSSVAFDISDPYSPEMTVETIYRLNYVKGPGRLIVRDSRAYIINTTNSSTTVINVENPLAPQLEYFVSDLKMQTVYGIGVDDHFIYLAGRDAKSFLVLEK